MYGLRNFTSLLILQSGEMLFGYSLGYTQEDKPVSGELCFTTSLIGYQHTITDPSFAGQIIIFSFPHIGNIGINDHDNESEKGIIHAKAMIISKPSTPSHYQSLCTLHQYLKKKKIAGIHGIDTRYLIMLLRRNNTQNATILSWNKNMNKSYIQRLIAKTQNDLKKSSSIKGHDLTSQVIRSIKDDAIKEKPVICIVDFGMKEGIKKKTIHEIEKRSLSYKVILIEGKEGFIKELISCNAKGILLSNGPGDPFTTASHGIKEQILSLLNKGIPIFGICLGHQLLAISLNLSTIKMPNGHRGSNHPIHNQEKDFIEITSQNHSFVIDESTLNNDVIITHRSLFDNSIAGIRSNKYPAFSVQYHPEASPGPNDSTYLFKEFIDMVEKYNKESRKDEKVHAITT